MVARYLTSIVKSQYVYQLSNGAFGIMLYEEKESDVDMIVQMIQHRFEEPFGYGAIEASPRWNITVAKVPSDIDDPSQLHYLFAGKSGGFEQKVIIRDSLSLRFIKRRSKIEGAIARGLRDNNFKVYYQPFLGSSILSLVSSAQMSSSLSPKKTEPSLSSDTGFSKKPAKWRGKTKSGTSESSGLRSISPSISFQRKTYQEDSLR